MEEKFEQTKRLHELVVEPAITPESEIFFYDCKVYILCTVKTADEENLKVSPETHVGYCTLGSNGKPDYQESGVISKTSDSSLPGLYNFIETGTVSRHNQHYLGFQYADQVD